MKEMENKYFIPDIEDICIGYECEQLINQVWTKEIFAKGSYLPENSDLLHWAHTSIINKNLRVPYLTKEQIEAEGWELLSEDKYLQFIKPGYSISYVEKLHLLIVIVLEEKQSNVIYSGKCKDINTFRKISKLLGI
jgi:hypothetical protein